MSSDALRAHPAVAHAIYDWVAKYPHPYKVFEHTVRDHLTANSTLLEAGCGRTAPLLQALAPSITRGIGVDLVPFTVAPAHNLEFHVGSIEAMPNIPDRCADLVIARSVMEHVRHPDAAYAEWRRVLKPGGRVIFLTPNFYDYASLAAAVIPNRLHPWIVKRTEGRDEQDTFPTLYRSNTGRAIRRLATRHGLTVEHVRYLGQYPNYLAFHPIPFAVGMAYARFTMSPLGRHLRSWILATLRAA